MKRVPHAAVIAVALGAAACSKPQPPKVTPESAKVTTVSAAGVDLDTRLAVENPNGIGLSARSVSAKITLDETIDLGDVDIPREVDLPPKSTTRIDVPMKVKWSGVQAVVALAISGRDVPYKIEGKLNMGGKMLNVDVPFTVTGKVTNAELMRAFWSSIPASVRFRNLPPPAK